ncbi:MAG: T9SS type A sorting domain-containing protein [Ignavibacteria bacterium]|nr:T9SS type A sorting domain-containing protein [Ignavibacteria bacterium]
MFDNNVLIAGINGSGVYKTSNNGSSWEPLNNGITDFSISKVYRDGQNNYYAGTNDGKVFKSVNAGASWTLIYSSEAGNAITSISTDAGIIYLSTRNYGVLKSTDNGIVWNEKNINLHIPILNTLAFSNTGEIYSGSYQGFNYSPDLGASWQTRNSGLPSRIIYSVYKTSGGKLLAGVYNLGLYSSSDNGMNWVPVSNGISSGAQIKSIKSSPNGFLFAANIPPVFSDTMELYRSSDNGLNWIKVFQPQTTGMDQFTIDADGNIFIAGTNSMFESSILVSTDNGTTWNETVLEEFFMFQNFTSSGKNLYLTFSNNIFYSSDFGLNWNQIPNGSWTTSGFSEISINTAGHIFASIGNEIYVTTDMGSTWTLRNSGLASSAVLNKFFFNDAGYLFGTTYYNGVFRSTNSTLTSLSSQVNSSPEGFRLEQNYPNPFNPGTVIRYSIPENSFVTLKIYDVLGHEVATLVNENQNRGTYNYQLSIVNYQLSSGIYFYKLETDNFTETRRMILVK